MRCPLGSQHCPHLHTHTCARCLRVCWLPASPSFCLPVCLPACSYAEIYNEEITDLLAPGGSSLQIRDGDAHRGVYVEDLSDHAAVNGGWVGGWVAYGVASDTQLVGWRVNCLCAAFSAAHSVSPTRCYGCS